MSDNVHQGHRAKMREKFNTGKHVLNDHELIEILLYYAIPRINTNSQAHELLNKAGGSIKGIFDLSEADICSIDELNKGTALYLNVLKELMIRIKKEELNTPHQNKLTRKNISNKLHINFIGETTEKMIMMTTDKDCRLISTHIVAQGTEVSASISIKKILSNAINDNATYVFLAHNHPNGTLAASDEDIETTKMICKALSLINVTVIEHYIVTETAEVGIIGKYNLFN